LLSPKEPIPNVTIQAQIEVLEALAAVDAELKELNDALTLERGGLQAKQSQLANLSERFDRSKKSVEDMEKMRNDLLGELRQMGQQVERSREKMSRVRTEREANAAQRELEELRKLYRDREQEVEKLENLIGQGRGESTQVSEEKERLSGELGSSEGAVMSRLAQSESGVAERNKVRAELASRIEPALYRRYELVRKRRGNAVAHTKPGGTCSACNIQIPPMMFQQLVRSQAFGQCPSCARILYYKAPSADEADAPAENT